MMIRLIPDTKQREKPTLLMARISKPELLVPVRLQPGSRKMQPAGLYFR
jgi:hypothetical protein